MMRRAVIKLNPTRSESLASICRHQEQVEPSETRLVTSVALIAAINLLADCVGEDDHQPEPARDPKITSELGCAAWASDA